MSKILEGVKVIDFTNGHFGSYATMIFSDFGADVIKIENITTGGDTIRTLAPKTEKGSAYHAYLNRGKKSMCLDLASEQGRSIILKLVADADVVCESCPSGVMEKYGLGYDELCKVNPKMIYASNTGFGKTGPMSDTAGSDLTAQAVSGLMDITGHEGTLPTAHGSRMAGQFGNMYFAIAIVAALLARDETGEGQQIDVAANDCMITALEVAFFSEKMNGIPYVKEGNASRAIAPYDTFRVKDGYVSTAVSTNAQWEKFCNAMGFPEYIDDERLNTNEVRGENYKNLLVKIIDEKFQHMTRSEIEKVLRPLNIPCGPVLTVEEAFDSEQIKHRNMVIELEDQALGKLLMPGMSIKLSEFDDEPRNSAPLLGEHTRSILTELGYGDEEIKRLADQGIISEGSEL